MTSRIVRQLQHELIEDQEMSFQRQQVIDRLIHADLYHQPGQHCFMHDKQWQITVALCKWCQKPWHLDANDQGCPSSATDLPD